MSSLLTNASAMTALQTLSSINKNMATTQNRIATGERVSTASDNAAYWSISTTMRSDNGAMSTVKDALGLGAAQVDVAYTAMDAVKDTLDTIKSKLVAASQPDVDKSKIQEEIKQLQNDLKTFAESASFSGGNWLSVENSSVQKVVASFTRDSAGNVSIGTIDIDTSKTALFSKNGAGLLQRAEGIDNAMILAETGTTGVTSTGGDLTRATQSIGATLDTEGGLSFDLTIGSKTQSVVLGELAGDATTAQDIADAINAQLADGTLSGFTVEVSGDNLVYTVEGQGSASALTISNSQIDGAAATAQNATGANANVNATATLNGTFAATTFDDDDSITFTLNVDGTDHNIKIDKATIDAALDPAAGDEGKITTQDQFVDVLNKALSNANLADDMVSVVDGKVVFTSGKEGADSKIEISALRHSSGSAAFDVLELDITNATSEQLTSYIQGVDEMFSAVTTAAADLGAIKSRIDSQQTFVGKIMDAIDRGVGQLVDADMNAESARLSALQTQQQLGIQALSIANQSSQNILSLFR